MSYDDNGLTAREFFEQLTPPEEDAPLFPGRQDPEWYRERARSLLLAGEWYAMGFLSPLRPDAKYVRVPSPLWHALDIHLYDSTIFGPGIHYSGVRFYEAGTAPDAQRALSEEEAKASYEQHIKDVFVAKRRTTHITEDEAWAKAAGVPRSLQRALRDASRAK